MSKLIILILAIFFLSCQKEIERNECLKFMVGTFELYNSKNELTHIVERNREFQIEFQCYTNKYDVVATIHWPNKCKYYLASYYKNGDYKFLITDFAEIIGDTAYTISYRENMKLFKTTKSKFVKIDGNNSVRFKKIIREIKKNMKSNIN